MFIAPWIDDNEVLVIYSLSSLLYFDLRLPDVGFIWKAQKQTSSHETQQIERDCKSAKTG
jgi:hypothetical protein